MIDEDTVKDATKRVLERCLDTPGKGKRTINDAIRNFIEAHGDVEAWKMMAERIEKILDGSNPIGQGTLSRMEMDKIGATLKLSVDIYVPY